jgi:mRNA interferase MazF
MTAPRDPKRGEVWRVDLEPTRGAEISKARPCVVINAAGVGRLPLRIVVPITEWDDRYAG